MPPSFSALQAYLCCSHNPQGCHTYQHNTETKSPFCPNSCCQHAATPWAVHSTKQLAAPQLSSLSKQHMHATLAASSAAVLNTLAVNSLHAWPSNTQPETYLAGFLVAGIHVIQPACKAYGIDTSTSVVLHLPTMRHVNACTPTRLTIPFLGHNHALG
jgi:hypothetical protein